MSPTSKPSLRAVVESIATSPSRAKRRRRAEGDSATGRPPGRRRSRRPSRPCRSRLASGDDPGLVLDRALSNAHAGQVLHVIENGGGERRRFGPLLRADGRLRADDCPSPRPTRRRCRRSSCERVGEHQGAADHRDAKNDREGRERRTQLAASSPLRATSIIGRASPRAPRGSRRGSSDWAGR